jgi:hypothetical protein
MKLELKHLAPYLPYELNLKIDTSLGISNRCFELDCGHDFNMHLFKGNVKPILRPLSDLTNEIVIGNVKFVPIDILFEKEYPRHLSKKYYNQTFYNYASVSHNGTAVSLKVYLGKIIEQNPRWIFEYLLKWHFDVFGLIEKGLAININALPQ